MGKKDEHIEDPSNSIKKNKASDEVYVKGSLHGMGYINGGNIYSTGILNEGLISSNYINTSSLGIADIKGGNSYINSRLNLEKEITDLKKRITELSAENKKEQEDLKADLTEKQKLNHIVTRISEEGGKKLFESEKFKNMFNNYSTCEAVVVSIDIRRSTELMLKARTAKQFSEFITELSYKLADTIISNYGIFDKFTGDGILAFFPKFYSGENAIIRALKATTECHKIFNEHYNSSRNCFNVFIKDIGLGIGIDYGTVTLVNAQSELTVVGIPVVYSCRFSNAMAGETIINEPAKEEILKICPELASFEESEISIKNEGVAIGYNVKLNDKAFEMEKPNWDELTAKYSEIIAPEEIK